jgi:hypothetical protein
MGNAAKLESKPVKNFFAWPSTREAALLTWELDTPDWINLRIERIADGAAPEVIARLSRSEQYLDSSVPRTSLTREIIYKMFVEGGDGNPVAVAGLGDTAVNPIAEIATTGQRALLLTHGFPVVWWPIKSTGARCECWDPIRKRILDENCPKCTGTGRRDGYGDPVLIYMMAESSEQRNVDITAGGEIEQNTRMLWTNADVRLRPRDVVVLADSKRLRVDSVVQNSNLGTRTRQICRMLEINPSDVEFDLIVPDSILKIIQTQPYRARLL